MEILKGVANDEIADVNKTYHLDKRIKKRTGLPRRSHANFLKRAIVHGLRINDTKSKSKLYTYLKSITQTNNYLIVYDRYIVMFAFDDVGITLLNLPKEYHRIVELLYERKNNEYKEAN